MKTKRFSKPDPKRKKKTHFKKNEEKKFQQEKKKLKSEIQHFKNEITKTQQEILKLEQNKTNKLALMPSVNISAINNEIKTLQTKIATFESEKKTKESEFEAIILTSKDPTSMKNEDEDEHDIKHKRKERHQDRKKRRHHRPPSVSHKKPDRNRERHTFSNSFYSQNDLFKSVPKQKQNQKKNHPKNKKGEKKEGKNKKMNEKKYEKPPSTKEPETLPNEMNMQKSDMKMEMEMKMKEKSANEIYESMKEDRRKLLFISYVEFLIRNHIEGLHYFKIGKKNREDDYVLVSYLIKEGSKYSKLWEKQLYKKIYQMIGKNPESYWILEVFTGKKYKGSSEKSEEEKDKYQKEFIQRLHDPTYSETFIQQITH